MTEEQVATKLRTIFLFDAESSRHTNAPQVIWLSAHAKNDLWSYKKGHNQQKKKNQGISFEML